jgi:hypothetical protein
MRKQRSVRPADPGGNVVDEVIEAALKVSEQFETLAVQVERMEQRRVMKDEQLRFAERALALRYPPSAPQDASKKDQMTGSMPCPA